MHGIIIPDYIELVVELEILICGYRCTSTHLAMQHRDRLRTRQAAAKAPTPDREQVDESINVPESSTHPQPSQSVRQEPALGPIPGQMEQMA